MTLAQIRRLLNRQETQNERSAMKKLLSVTPVTHDCNKLRTSVQEKRYEFYNNTGTGQKEGVHVLRCC